MDSVKELLLNGRRVLKQPSEALLVALDASLQRVLVTVRHYLRSRAQLETPTQQQQQTGLSSSTGFVPPLAPPAPPPTVVSTAPSIARHYDLVNLKFIRSYFDSSFVRESSQEFRQTDTSDIIVSLLERIDDDTSGVPRRMHRVGLRVWPKAFRAKDCVIWLVQNGFAPTALEAANIFTAMCRDR